MRHLALRCPRCRSESSVWIDDLGQTIRCRRCRAPFHVDSSGQCVRGERPIESERNRYSVVETAPRANWALLERWARLPRVARWCILAAVAAVPAFLAVGILKPARVDVPESLLDRTHYAGMALVRNDREALIAVADPATTVSTMRWLDVKRPAGWSVWNRAEEARVQTSILFQNLGSRSACTVATIAFPPFDSAPPPRVKSKSRQESTNRTSGPRLELVMLWKLQDDGLWVFDGGRTIKEATRR